MAAATASSAPLQAVDPATDKPAPPAKRSRAKVLFPVLVGVAVLVGGTLYVNGRGKETTDDAFVESHVANVAPRVPGQVLHVLVKDNQAVNAGDVLVELDDRDATARDHAAKADLESAQAALAASNANLTLAEHSVDAGLRQARGGVTQAFAMSGSSKAQIDQARADLTAAESRASLTATELGRAEKLNSDGAVAQAELDNRRSQNDQARAAVDQAKARLVAATVGVVNAGGGIESAQGRLAAAQTGPDQVEVARAQVDVAKARVDQAQAALEQADLNLSYMKVRAPTKGVVSRRSVEPGQLVDPARPLLALTELDDSWIIANFKEDQIGDLRVGQAAKVTLDAFSGHQLNGHVDSFSGGTGSRFALLPPDNASGNFTKVVQRVPVLIRIDDKPGDIVLRPGLSAYVVVRTGG
ncbi:MAG TPA: HlyD family secretion protein [Polyangiaceae bacterium]|jgi:membrane fusion protein (multidrug efflux system)|nr:HlyD family secretion protein [Polyangiaceae bacterium]